MHSTELAAKVAADYSVRLLAAAIAMVGPARDALGRVQVAPLVAGLGTASAPRAS